MKRALFIVLLLVVPLTASAKSTRETTYRYSQIWNTAVRFLRVDNGFPITEKDQDSGYLMFDYTESGQQQVGSLELIETVKENRRTITIGLRVQNMPSYIETMLLDKLERKLRDEYGDPPASLLLPKENAAKKRDDAAKPPEDAEENPPESEDSAS